MSKKSRSARHVHINNNDRTSSLLKWSS